MNLLQHMYMWISWFILVNMKLYVAFLCFWGFQVVLSTWVTLKAAYDDLYLGFLLSGG